MLAVTEGLFLLIFHEHNPSVSFADSSPYTGEPIAAAGLLNGKSLFGITRLAGGFRYTKKECRHTCDSTIFPFLF